jgi:hypothetical protein
MRDSTNFFGSSSSLCIEAAPEAHSRDTLGLRHRQRVQRDQVLGAARPGDGVKAGTCRHCGIVGIHPTPAERILELRGMVADIQFRAAYKRKSQGGVDLGWPRAKALRDRKKDCYV